MGTVHLEGKTVEVQDAFDAISNKVRSLQVTLDETLANASTSAVNKTETSPYPMDMTLADSKPSFELVSSIAHYDGEKADLVAPFFDNIEGIGELSNWSEAQKLQVLKLKLTGSALQFAKSDEKCKNSTTLEEIKAAFMERFGDSLPDHYYFEQLASIRQNRGETIEQFSDRVKRVSDKTLRVTNNAEANQILREEADRRAMDAFVRGLNGEIGRQTRIKFPKTFREAVTTAIALNNLEKRPSEFEEKTRRVFGTITDTTCYTCGKPGHKARECQSRRVDIVCYTCKKKGHKERDCRSKSETTTYYCENCRKPGHTANNCWGMRNTALGRGAARGGTFRSRGYQHGGRGSASNTLNHNEGPRHAAGNLRNH
ncbi:hypothetical protein J6590_108695 [Homalodisca vitripennis]|nr:hypothetical protein J6590_108695 [Homalodisca vitripennis]